MSGTMPDFDGVNMPGVIKPGNYHITVEEVSENPSRAGDPMITIRFSIDGDAMMFSQWYPLVTKGERNEMAISRLMQLSDSVGMGTSGGYDLHQLNGKKCGALLDMDGDFVRVRRYFDPAKTEVALWENEDNDMPF